MSAPEGFTLPFPVYKNEIPEKHAPKYLKHQVYDSPDVFKKIDEHALQVAQRDHPTFKDLMWDLIYRYELNELERARVIFRWMACKDFNNITFHSIPSNSPEEVLSSFQDGHGTYARIFQVICDYAGIVCITISGYAKGIDYLPGDSFSDLDFNHSWNVIYIMDSWQLVDAHWGARYLSAGKNAPVYEYDDFYFLMEPQQAIYSHFPKDPDWQLLQSSLTLSQFESLPLTKSQFFKCAIDFLDQHHGIVQSRHGRLDMSLGFCRPGVSFTYKLQYLASPPPGSNQLPFLSDKDPVTDKELKRYVCQETTNDRLNFSLRLPTRGIYYLSIYAQRRTTSLVHHLNHHCQESSTLPPGRESLFRAACEYKITCDSPNPADVQPFPTCHDANWGPSWSHIDHYGLEPSHKEGLIILASDNRSPPHTQPSRCLDIGFTRRRPEVTLLAKLYRNDVPDGSLDKCQTVTESASNSLFHINLPEPGEYGLEIYANEPADGEPYTHICQYLINYEGPSAASISPPRLTASGSDAGPSPGIRWSPRTDYGDSYRLPHPYVQQQYNPSGEMHPPLDTSTTYNPSTNGLIQYNHSTGYQPGHSHSPPITTTNGTTSYLAGLDAGLTGISLSNDPPNGQSTGLQQYRQSISSGGDNGVGSNHPAYTQQGGGGNRYQPQSMISQHGPPYSPTSTSSTGPGYADTYRTSTTAQIGGFPTHQQQYDRIKSTSSGIQPISNVSDYRPDQSTANWSTGPIQREPPKEFALNPLDVDAPFDKPRPQELPPMHADKSMQPFSSSDAFRRVDEHAFSISQQQQTSFKQLIWQLIYARELSDELEKVRAIFLWLCTKDLHKMNFSNVAPDSPEDILMGIRTGKSTYAQIFYTLCRYANLHCKLLIGYAKGAEYTPGMQFSGRQGQHSWNAVLIDQIWRLVDCHWAARRLIGKRPNQENVRYGLDMFYFLAHPGQLIYTHFPHDKDWQLLRHPITLKEFENLAPVKSAFFKYNLDLVTHRNAVIICPEPEVCVVIAFPPQAEQYLSFTFGLSIDNKEGSEEYRGVPLSRYGRQETLVRDHISQFFIRPPRPGAYKLLVYVRQQQHQQPSGSDSGLASTPVLPSSGGGSLDELATSGVTNMYGAICEYRLVTNFSANQSLPPYPPCQSSSYGPNELAKTYGLRAFQLTNTLQATGGCVDLRFNLTVPSVRLMAKLKCALIDEGGLARSILQRSVANSDVVISLMLPEAGEYGLEIYANHPSRDGNSFYVVWQYLIVSDSAAPVAGLPHIPPACLGPMPRFEAMGLATTSHSDPFIKAQAGELCVQLNFNPRNPLRIMAHLIYATNDASEDCSQQVLQQMKANECYFLIRFPRSGYYKLQIYALPNSEPGDSVPCVYNYLIEALRAQRGRQGKVMSFPQQFAQWKQGCYLQSPLDGILNPTSSSSGGDLVDFRANIPHAHSVAVVVGDDWTYLKRLLDDQWQGSVSLKSHWGRSRMLAVCANFDKADENFGTLLEYQLSG